MALVSTSASAELTNGKLILAASSVILGLFLVLLVGLSSPMEAHNAAHDTRHAAAFPCH